MYTIKRVSEMVGVPLPPCVHGNGAMALSIPGARIRVTGCTGPGISPCYAACNP